MIRPGRRPHPGLAALALLALLAGCGTPPETGGLATSAPPVARPRTAPPEGPSQAEIRKARAERNRARNEVAAQTIASAASTAQRSHYMQVERDLLARGRLRQARIPQDAPIDADSLARDFLQIALRDEYGRDGARMTPGGGPAPLRRWQAPVRMSLEFGDSTDLAEQGAIRNEVAAYAARLARASGHGVGLTGGEGNFTILFLTDDERRAIGPRLSALIPGIPPEDVAALGDLAPGNFCTVFAYSRGDSAVYVHAVALIRAELPPLLRLSCIHEELAQGMGLANDSPKARPSIFNDDEEFALLTRHDELLLQILYDPRLRPGMTEAEAAPIVHQIARDLLPGNL